MAPLAPWLERSAGATTLDERVADAAAAAPVPGKGQQGGDAAIETLPLSLGYLEGSELLSNLRKLDPDLRVLTVERRGNTFTAGRRMLPSHSFPSGDPALVGGALRATVHDLYPRLLPDGPARDQWPQALDLDVFVPLLDPPAGTARFAAWSYRRLPAEDRSARVSFLLWPDFYSDVVLRLRVVPGGAGAQPRRLEARFTLANDHGRPRLLKGVYLLGVNPGAWDEPFELPDDPAQVPVELLSVLMTVEPEGLRLGSSRR